MKSIYKTALIMGLLLGPSFVFAATFSPNPIATGCSTILDLDANSPPSAGNTILGYDTNGALELVSSPGNFGPNPLSGYGFTVCGNGVYHFIYGNSSDPSWSTGASSYATAITEPWYMGIDQCLPSGSGSCSPTPPPVSGLPGEIAAAEQGMASTTGFNISSVVVWSGNNLVKLFIGSGLGVIYGLRFWIAAMLIITAIVFFSFRAFQFFKH